MSVTPHPSSGLHLRVAIRDDRDEICALIAAESDLSAGSATADRAIWDWLYWDNPYGQPSGVVWQDGGTVVAHAGTYRGLGTVEGRIVRTGRLAHVVTARPYRGRGLYGSMVRRLKTHLGRDFDLLVALPTAAARPGLEGEGVMHRDRAMRWFRPVTETFGDLGGLPRPLAVALSRLAFGPPPDGDGRPVDGLPDDLDDLAAAGLEDGPLTDRAWWQWRFTDHPVHRYEFYRAGRQRGTTALLAARPVPLGNARLLQVLHWQALDEEAAAGVLGAALAAHPDCVAVTLMATDGTRVAEWARRCGLRRVPSVVDDTSGYLGLAAAEGSGAVLPGRHWNVSLAAHHDR